MKYDDTSDETLLFLFFGENDGVLPAEHTVVF
jgi:hypothetical protein